MFAILGYTVLPELGDGHRDEAESTYDVAHLFLTQAREHVIREPLPIPSRLAIIRKRLFLNVSRWGLGGAVKFKAEVVEVVVR